MLLPFAVLLLHAAASTGLFLPVPIDMVRTDTLVVTPPLSVKTDSSGRKFYRIRETSALDNPAYRVLDADGQLLYMSPPATAEKRAVVAPAWVCLRPSSIERVEILKGGVVAASFGRDYERNGVVVITLTSAATRDWRLAESAFQTAGRISACSEDKAPARRRPPVR
jgi:hypothetical protein